MTILPPKTAAADTLEAAFDLQLCKRDYLLLVEYQPDLLAILEKWVDAGATDDAIRRLAYRRLAEPVIIQRVLNAANWIRNRE